MNLIVKEIRNILGDLAVVEMHEVSKNNGVVLHGVTIKLEESQNILPTLYIENYDERKTSREIAKDIITDNANALSETRNIEIKTETLTAFNDFTKSHIVYRLVNKKANEELLKTIPHREFLDLAIIYVVQITDEASAKITNSLAKNWNVTEEELFNLATENTPRIHPISVKSLFDIMCEMMNLTPQEALDAGMVNNTQIVVTNENATNGAIAILYPNAIENIYKVCGPIAILPSSIHEVIVVPFDDKMTEHELTEMVKDVNSQVVDPSEILSDHVYIYDGEWK
jgi:hypothetical protein